MEASVFFVWLVRHVVDRIIASRYLNSSHTSSNGLQLTCEQVVVSLPTSGFYSCPYKVDAIAVALNSALSYVEDLFHGNLAFRSIRLVPDCMSLVASQAQSLGLPTSPADMGNEIIPRSTGEDRFLLACHVGGVSSSFSFVKLPMCPSDEPFVLLGSVVDASGAGGDAIDHAILHHILSHHQTAYIASPMSSEAKPKLLERIRRAKEEAVLQRAPVQVLLLGGPAAQDPSATFNLSVDLVESIATDTLFRKFTKTLQQASASALQTTDCPMANVSALSPPDRRKRMESLPLEAMRLLRPAVVIASGRGLGVQSLKKRVESLCRTLGTTGGASSASSSTPVTFVYEQPDPSIEGMCSYGALVLEAWSSSSLIGLRRTVEDVSHRCSLGMLMQAAGNDCTLHTDVLIKVHGDNWGMLAPHGTPLPLYRTRRLELLNRGPESPMALPPDTGSRFPLPGSSSGLLNATLEICCNGPMPGDEQQQICLMDVWLPKLSATDGGDDRFSVTLDLRIGTDGEIEVLVVHEASRTVLHRRSRTIDALVSSESFV
jgi:hypothetical protein